MRRVQTHEINTQSSSNMQRGLVRREHLGLKYYRQNQNKMVGENKQMDKHNPKCEKHKTKQKAPHRAKSDRLMETYLCFEPGCDKYEYCQNCEEEHEEHSQKFMSLQEILDKMEQLLFKLRKKGSEKVSKASQILQKYELLNQFKTTIDKKFIDIENQLFLFLSSTENMVESFSLKKNETLSRMQKLEKEEKQSQISQAYQLSRSLKLEFKDQSFQRTKEAWAASVNSLNDKENELKDYCMKMIQIITDDDYEEVDKSGVKEANKFCQLHRDVKKMLLEKKEQNEQLFDSMSTKISSTWNSESEFRKEEDDEKKWLSKILDLYQVN